MKFILIAVAAVACCATPCSNAQSADTQPTLDADTTRFELSIDEGAPGSVALQRGDYQEAIRVASRQADTSSSVSAQHNLCVAFIVIREFEKADAACDKALQLAHRVITTERNPHGRKDKESLAKAYSNIHVLEQLREQHAQRIETSRNTPVDVVADNHREKTQTTDRQN